MVESSSDRDYQRLYEDLIQLRTDVDTILPDTQRTQVVDDATGIILERLVKEAIRLELDFKPPKTQFRWAHAPKYADLYLIVGQILVSLKRKKPKLFEASIARH